MQEEAPTIGGVTLPPRPNPGPEPWDEPFDWALPIIAMAVLAIALGCLMMARRRNRRRGVKVPELSLESTSTSLVSRDDPPGDPIEAAAAIRALLASRLGREWGARTTEEFGKSAGLADALGAECAEKVMRILARADRLKFDPEARVEVDYPSLRGVWAEVVERLDGPGMSAPSGGVGRPRAGGGS